MLSVLLVLFLFSSFFFVFSGFSSAVANAENGMQTFRRRAQPRVAGTMLPLQSSGRFTNSGRVKKIVKRYETGEVVEAKCEQICDGGVFFFICGVFSHGLYFIIFYIFIVIASIKMIKLFIVFTFCALGSAGCRRKCRLWCVAFVHTIMEPSCSPT